MRFEVVKMPNSGWLWLRALDEEATEAVKRDGCEEAGAVPFIDPDTFGELYGAGSIVTVTPPEGT